MKYICICICVFTLNIIFLSLVDVYSEKYSPKVNIELFPKFPIPDKNVEINATVFDEFANINASILSYSIDNGTSWKVKPMSLIWGNLNNGTFFGEIPGQKENTTVKYKIYFQDELGYEYNSTDEYKVSKDLEGPLIYSLKFRIFEKPGFITIYLKAKDESKIDNITLFFISTRSLEDEGANLRSNHTDSIKLKLVNGSNTDGEYQGEIEAVKSNGHIVTGGYFYYKILSYDSLGNKNITNQFNTLLSPLPLNLTSLHTALIIHEITNNNTIKGTFDIGGFSDTPLNNITIINGEVNNNNNNNYVTNIEQFNSIFKNLDYIEFTLDSNDNIIFHSDNISLNLLGEPSTFPFDKYYLNIIFPIPKKNIQLISDLLELSNLYFRVNETFMTKTNKTFMTNIVDFDNSLKNRWSPSYNTFIGDINQLNNTFRQEFGIPLLTSIFCNNQLTSGVMNMMEEYVVGLGGEKTDEFGQGSNITNNFFPFSNIICSTPDKYSLINIKVDFTRNYTILAIIIPLFAIFFLLGSIFIFENTKDNIGNRLTLSLSVFALIFTLPSIIDSMKPSVSLSTIADSLFSIIVITSISFTVSSVISNSNVLQKKFPRGHSWIDVITFFLASGMVIALLSSYDINIIIWLIPLIIFGLGYGLLLRLIDIIRLKPN
jgi:hypothetical protein